MTAAAPVSSQPLTRRSAVALGAAIRAGEVTAREVVEEHIEVLRAAQPRTRALAVDRFETALAEADEADATQPAGPLHGVPCT
ncbi:MAG: amidase family protein, partial [Actinomycetota bacterium]|nr:amidase family protein [Actinomycetota bacterium]